jgi:translation initiation factor IF-2
MTAPPPEGARPVPVSAPPPQAQAPVKPGPLAWSVGGAAVAAVIIGVLLHFSRNGTEEPVKPPAAAEADAAKALQDKVAALEKQVEEQARRRAEEERMEREAAERRQRQAAEAERARAEEAKREADERARAAAARRAEEEASRRAASAPPPKPAPRATPHLFKAGTVSQPAGLGAAWATITLAGRINRSLSR